MCCRRGSRWSRWPRTIPTGSGPRCASGVVAARTASTKRLFGPPPDPVDVLRELVDLFDTGRRAPLPLPLKTSCAWAEARHNGDDPVDAARDQWTTQRFHTGEDDAPAHRKVWGDNAPLERLIDAGLAAHAERLWLPMLTAERDAW